NASDGRLRARSLRRGRCGGESRKTGKRNREKPRGDAHQQPPANFILQPNNHGLPVNAPLGVLVRNRGGCCENSALVPRSVSWPGRTNGLLSISSRKSACRRAGRRAPATSPSGTAKARGEAERALKSMLAGWRASK